LLFALQVVFVSFGKATEKNVEVCFILLFALTEKFCDEYKPFY
jgi:hypothetical protein